MKNPIQKRFRRVRSRANKDTRDQGALGGAYRCTLMALKVAKGDPQDPASWASDAQMAEAVDKVMNAGSVFIGPFTPESAGDYASGTNHTLPTNGYALDCSGVSLDSFMKRVTFQQISRKGLKEIGWAIQEMAEAETLTAHKNSISIRLDKSNGENSDE